MQCGNYSIEVPKLQEGEQYRFHFDATACVGCRCCEVACNEQNNNPADVKWRRVGEMEGGLFPHVMQLFNSMSCNHCIDRSVLSAVRPRVTLKLKQQGLSCMKTRPVSGVNTVHGTAPTACRHTMKSATSLPSVTCVMNALMQGNHLHVFKHALRVLL